MEDNYRKGLTFEQAEGVAPLPRQLSRKEISPGLRSQIKAFVHFSVGEASGLYGGKTGRLDDEWEGILLRHHIHRLHQTVPNFSTSIDYQRQMIDRELYGDYIKFYGLIQYILRDKQVPDGFAEAVKEILDEHMAGYRLLDSDTLVPLASDEEIVAIEKSIENISLHGNAGTRQHLKTASEQLSIGHLEKLSDPCCCGMNGGDWLLGA